MPSFLRIQDIFDILIMSLLLYQLYSWFRRTRAIQVMIGLGVVTLIYFVTRFLGLYMTSWILQELGTVLIILIIVVFQAEIRQALYRLSLLRTLSDTGRNFQLSHFQQIAEALFELAAKRTGAIVAFERNEALHDLMLNGVRLDCEISPAVLETIFHDGTPLHDGAILIRGDRIAMAACHLPLSLNSDLPQFLGTRHRAAIGLSERTDAIVAVISEERGEVSLAVGGELNRLKTPDALTSALNELLIPVKKPSKATLPQMLFRNLLPKASILLMVIVFWALITTRQGQIVNVTTPVRLHGIPDQLVLLKVAPEELDVQLKSFSSLTPAPEKMDVSAELDLTGIKEGLSTIRVRNSDLRIPSGTIVNSITPTSVKVAVERKVRKVVPVRVAVKGRSRAGILARSIPENVEIEGPASQVARVDAVDTEELDPTKLATARQYRCNLVPPQNRITVLRDEPVTVFPVQPGKPKR